MVMPLIMSQICIVIYLCMGRKRRTKPTGDGVSQSTSGTSRSSSSKNSKRAKSIPTAGAGHAGGSCQAAGGRHATGPVAGVYPTLTGEVELRPDPFVAGGWEVFVNGVPSSHIAPDPLQLEYEYMRWIAAGCEVIINSRLDATKLRMTHLGGGACSLARYFAQVYPKARQTVVELDAELARLVREWFDVPRAPRLKIRVGDARAVADGFSAASRDVVIRDVFAGAVTPYSVTTVEFLRAVHHGLAPGGLYVANCGDHADLRGARSELRSMAEVFTQVGVIADPPMLKGRRYGNIVLLGSDGPLPVAGDAAAAQLTKRLLAGAVPARYEDDEWVRGFMAVEGRVLFDERG